MFTKRNARVAEEAAALRVATHPGVVELVDTAGGALRTRMVDGRAVGEMQALPAGEVAGLAAALATTLADLHGLGVVHGAIDASHVLVTAGGRPVLCSLGRGGEPPDDVAGLGRLVTALLEAAPAETGGRTRVRGFGPRRRLGPMLAPPAAPALAALARQATSPDPAERPTARAFAEAVSRRVPSARLPRLGSVAPGAVVPPAAPAGPAPAAPAGARGHFRARSPRFDGKKPRIARVLAVKGRQRPLGGALGGVLLALAAGSVAVVWALSDRRQPATAPSPPSPSTSHADGGPARTTPAVTRVWPAEPVDFRDGVLVHGGARYSVGRPGDALVAADWRCTGVVGLALLRRDDGEVFAFDRWPEAGGAVTGRPLGKVPGATDLRVVDADADGCPELQVERAGGNAVRLEVASS